MSGTKHKTISISEQEYWRIINQKSQYQNQINQLRNKLRNAENNSKRQAQIQKELNKLYQDQQRLINEGIGNLQSDLRQTESRHAEQLQQLQNDYSRALQQVADHFEEELISQDAKLGKVKDKLQNQLNLQHEEMQRQGEKIDTVKDLLQKQLNMQRKEYLEIAKNHHNEITKLNSEIDNIKNKDAKKQSIRVARYRDLLEIIKNIDENYPHEKFAPGEMAGIHIKAANIKNQLDQEMDCNSMIWALYYEVCELRDKIIRKQTEFQNELIITRQYLEMLLEISKNDKINDDEASNIDLKIDYWADNRYIKVTEELDSIKESLKNAESSNFNLADLRKLYQRMGELESEQTEIMELAIKRVIASKKRRELAMDIAMKLNKKGYNIIPETEGKKEHGYIGEDPRGAYLLKIKTNQMEDATETVALISPVERDEGISNELVLSTTGRFDDLKTRQIQAKEVLEAIGQEVGDNSQVSSMDNHIDEINGKKTSKLLNKGEQLPNTVQEILKKDK